MAKSEGKEKTIKSSGTITLNISESIYERFVKEIPFAHEVIRQAFKEAPGLFPPSMSDGYKLNGKTTKSTKQGLVMRKIHTGNRTYQLRPVFQMPYMRGKVEDISKGLFLLRFGVPFWALAIVLGKNAMYWYRCFISLAQHSLAGTSCYNSAVLPSHIVADEQHIRVKGKRAYVATTVANGCILGAEVSASCDEEGLSEAYKVFVKETQGIKTDYQPKTVNTDGWQATQNAWKLICPTIQIIECFLHAFIKVRDRATKKLKKHFLKAADMIWNCYKADNKRSFSQRIRRLSEWAKENITESAMKQNVIKLCNKTQVWQTHYVHPNAYRTSNMLDRLMKFMSRHAANSQMFHSSIKATTLNFRAFALLYNFTPSCPLTLKKHGGMLDSPVARMNGEAFSSNWLENLLLAAEIDDRRIQHRNPLL